MVILFWWESPQSQIYLELLKYCIFVVILRSPPGVKINATLTLERDMCTLPYDMQFMKILFLIIDYLQLAVSCFNKQNMFAIRNRSMRDKENLQGCV